MLNNNVIVCMTVVTALSTALYALLTIIIILQNKKNRELIERPYLIAYLAQKKDSICIVFSNTGRKPGLVRHITIDDENSILYSYNKDTLEYLKSCNILFAPGQEWVLPLYKTNTSDMHEKVYINIQYAEILNEQQYSDRYLIDFDSYKGMLLYSTDLDEVRKTLNNTNKILKTIGITVGKMVNDSELQNDLNKIETPSEEGAHAEGVHITSFDCLSGYSGSRPTSRPAGFRLLHHRQHLHRCPVPQKLRTTAAGTGSAPGLPPREP